MPVEPLVQIVDAALADAARKAGSWLACRKGCTQCCMGPFPISTRDAARLREGLAEVEPDRAARVVQRARESVVRLERDYPGDTVSQLLLTDDAAENEACPALDTETGACDLYGARPITCRLFGPAIYVDEEPLRVCELCFVGATDEQIAQCAVSVDIAAMEDDADEQTIVAYALADVM